MKERHEFCCNGNCPHLEEKEDGSMDLVGHEDVGLVSLTDSNLRDLCKWLTDHGYGQ